MVKSGSPSKAPGRVLVPSMLAAAAMALVGAFGYRVRQPLQRYGEFEAVRCIRSLSLFGLELFAVESIGVVPSFTRQGLKGAQGYRRNVRILGQTVSGDPGDDQYRIGNDDIDGQGAIRYILTTKMTSSNVADRLWFVAQSKQERYPGHRSDLRSLLHDPIQDVREAARTMLGRTDGKKI